MNNSESAREREAEALRKWFSSQRRFGSWAAMERALNVTKHCLNFIKNGKRRAVDAELRSKLYDVTGLEEFKPIHREPRSITNAVRQNIPKGAKSSSTNAQGTFPELPYNLPEKLKFALEKLGLTISECSDKYGLSPNVLKKYKRGVARPRAEKNIKAVMEILADAKTLPRMMAQIPKRDDYEQAKKIKELLVHLAHELEYFKQTPDFSRETFRKVVPGEDVGYITTLLRALYNEDQFQRWLLFSKYEMRSEEELKE